MEKERKSFENLQSDTGRAFKVLNERRIVIQGAQDYSIFHRAIWPTRIQKFMYNKRRSRNFRNLI